MNKLKNDFREFTVVSIDDNEISLYVVESICKEMNLNIKSFSKSPEALEFLLNNPVHLIVTDYEMPDLNGLELIKEYRKINQNVPIVMITALGADDNVHKKALSIGANDFLSKPVNSILFEARITNLLLSYKKSLIIDERAKDLEKEVEKKTKELKLLNENLESRVKEEVESNRKKDILLQQQSRLSSMGEMIGNIAHQWRQPLSAISTSVSAFNFKYELGMFDKKDVNELNERVLSNVRFLSETIEIFRNFFNQEQELKEFNISKVINNSLEMVNASYENSFIKIKKDIDESINYYGNENLLSQVFLNLFNNARDAFIINKITYEKIVKISLKLEDSKIIILVEDNAMGIPEDIIEKIFDPYFTTKHQSQGTGLGLYMSSQIIKSHFKGSIKVKNVEDKNLKGACFYLEFPIIYKE